MSTYPFYTYSRYHISICVCIGSDLQYLFLRPSDLPRMGKVFQGCFTLRVSTSQVVRRKQSLTCQPIIAGSISKRFREHVHLSPPVHILTAALINSCKKHIKPQRYEDMI